MLNSPHTSPAALARLTRGRTRWSNAPRRRWSPRSLRVAVTALFALDGVVFGSWAVRVPDVSHHLAASPASLGAALLCVSLGALATMRLTGALCDRLGPGLITTVGGVLLCATVALPGLATSIPELGAALLVFGAATGVLNVAVNTMGVRLQAGHGRPLMPSLHAALSFGGLGGGLAGGLAAGSASPAVHLLTVGAAGLAATAWAARPLLASDDPDARPQDDVAKTDARGRRGRGSVIALGAIAGCTAYGEGALTDWGALHLATDLQATALVASVGYAGFSLAMACGRLAGHRLIHTLGETPLLVGGALLAAAGMLVGALSPLVWPAVLGFVLVGLGLANIFPLAIARAGAVGGASAVGLASTVGYAGLLGGPPLIGFITSRTGLPAALTTISVLALVAAGLALALARGADRATEHASERSPWYEAGLLARPGALLAPVGLGVRLAAQRHATTLATLTPGGHAEPAAPPSPLSTSGAVPVQPYPGLEHLLR
jgi:MFS family permease